MSRGQFLYVLMNESGLDTFIGRDLWGPDDIIPASGTVGNKFDSEIALGFWDTVQAEEFREEHQWLGTKPVGFCREDYFEERMTSSQDVIDRLKDALLEEMQKVARVSRSPETVEDQVAHVEAVAAGVEIPDTIEKKRTQRRFFE